MDELLDALERSAEAFEAQTDRLLIYAAQVGVIRACCPAHAEESKLVVDAVERRN